MQQLFLLSLLPQQVELVFTFCFLLLGSLSEVAFFLLLKLPLSLSKLMRLLVLIASIIAFLKVYGAGAAHLYS